MNGEKIVVTFVLTIALFLATCAFVRQHDRIEALTVRIQGLEAAWRRDHKIGHENVVPSLDPPAYVRKDLNGRHVGEPEAFDWGVFPGAPKVDWPTKLPDPPKFDWEKKQ